MSEGESPGSEQYSVKILIPIATYVDKEKITRALHALSAFRNPLLVLFHVIELPSSTVPVNGSLYGEEISRSEARLGPIADWLSAQGYAVRVRVVVARKIAEGIIDEANSGGYAFVVMMKRKIRRGIGRLFQRSVSEAVIKSTKCMVLTALVEQA